MKKIVQGTNMRKANSKRSSARGRLTPCTTAKDFWTSLTPYEPSRYERITLDRLIVVGINRLVLAGIETTFDNIVVVSHRLFPDKFSLISFPEYPDSIRVDNTLRLDCRHSRYVNGSRPKGFALTELGKIAAEDTRMLIETGGNLSISAEAAGERRHRATLLVKEAHNSDAFRKYDSGQQPSKFDVCDVLHGSLDTGEDLLKQNLGALQAYAKMIRPIREYRSLADSVLQFLGYLGDHWEGLMHD